MYNLLFNIHETTTLGNSIRRNFIAHEEFNVCLTNCKLNIVYLEVYSMRDLLNAITRCNFRKAHFNYKLS